MKHHSAAAAISLGHKVKDTAPNLGLDTTMLAARHVAERIASEMPTDIPYYIKGGLMFPQTLRETTDVDLVAIRRISDREIQNGFKVLAPYLEREGIIITSVSKPRELDVGLRNPIDRWKVEAMCGTVRAHTTIDLTWENGQDSIWANAKKPPRFIERPSPIKGAKPLRVRAQHLEEAAAERLLAIIMQPKTDLRCKYLADAVNGNLWPDDLNCAAVARALRRTMHYREIPLSQADEFPEAFRWSNIRRLEADWNASRNAARSGSKFDEAFLDLQSIWAGVYSELQIDLAIGFRRPPSGPIIVNGKPAPAVAPAFKP